MTLSLRRILATAGIAILLTVAAIGVVRATPPAASTSPGSAALSTPAVAPTGAASGLDDQVAGELDAILAADQSAATQPAPAGRIARGQLRRLAAWRHLVPATVVVDLDKVGLTTIQLAHGTISAVSAASLTISETG